MVARLTVALRRLNLGSQISTEGFDEYRTVMTSDRVCVPRFLMG